LPVGFEAAVAHMRRGMEFKTSELALQFSLRSGAVSTKLKKLAKEKIVKRVHRGLWRRT
jgi:DNA-binding MarR family transcriptional regulator